MKSPNRVNTPPNNIPPGVIPHGPYMSDDPKTMPLKKKKKSNPFFSFLLFLFIILLVMCILWKQRFFPSIMDFSHIPLIGKIGIFSKPIHIPDPDDIKFNLVDVKMPWAKEGKKISKSKRPTSTTQKKPSTDFDLSWDNGNTDVQNDFYVDQDFDSQYTEVSDKSNNYNPKTVSPPHKQKTPVKKSTKTQKLIQKEKRQSIDPPSQSVSYNTSSPSLLPSIDLIQDKKHTYYPLNNNPRIVYPQKSLEFRTKYLDTQSDILAHLLPQLHRAGYTNIQYELEQFNHHGKTILSTKKSSNDEVFITFYKDFQNGKPTIKWKYDFYTT